MTYPEAEVTALLQRFHPDHAALRRYLVENEFLERRDGLYWRAGGTVNLLLAPDVPTRIVVADPSTHWPQIWPFWSRIVQAGETYAYPDRLTSPQAQALWMPGPPDRVTVAIDPAGRVLGTAKMGANRPGRGAHIGTASFMVSPNARGRGVGRLLAQDMIAWHREEGFDGIQFNAVVATNAAAVALWQDLGFEIIGTVPGAFDSPTHGKVGLHIMYLPLR